MPGPPPDSPSGTIAEPIAPSFQQAVVVTLCRLQAAVIELLAAVPAETRRAADVERAFGVDPKLGWQVHKLATTTSPLSQATNVPATVSVQRLLKSGERMGLPDALIARTSEAFAGFERLVEEYAGDRERFASMIGGLVREEGEDLDQKYKKAAFRAMSHFWGAEVRVFANCTLMHPGPDAGRQTYGSLVVHAGAHRLRADAPLHIPVGKGWSWDTSPQRAIGLQQYDAHSAKPLAGSNGPYLMKDFTTPGVEDLRLIGANSERPLLEVPHAVGLKNSVTITTASIIPNVPDPYQPGPSELFCWPRVRIPTETMISDFLIHEKAVRCRQPVPTRVRVYGSDRLGPGSTEPTEAEQTDLLPMREVCEYRGRGPEVLSTPELPRHAELIRSMCAMMGWNADEFHAYRCRVVYPLMRSGVRIDFDINGN